MTTAEGTADAIALLDFLDAQRECVLAIVDGLDENQLTTPVLPSGWEPAWPDRASRARRAALVR
jgi:Protein of unknown function (DUF664)